MKLFTPLILLFLSVSCWSQDPCPNLVSLGPDITVCNGARFTLNPNPLPNVQFSWLGFPGLSCTDCPSPEVINYSTGIYIYIVLADNGQCIDMDTIRINVLNGVHPQYVINSDRNICVGNNVHLGGEQAPGTFYSWTSNPPGFASNIADPVVSPNVNTTYYLEAQNGSCPVIAIDSIKVNVYNPPVLQLQKDTAICNGSSVLLGKTPIEPGVSYSWSPNGGTLNDSLIANPLATPLQNTIYTLSAQNPGCISTASVLVAVVSLDLTLNVPDTVLLCRGASIPVVAMSNPSVFVNWSPASGVQLSNNGQSAVVAPTESTLYQLNASLPGCTRRTKLYVRVDSLPYNLKVYPADTTVCIGNQVLLKSATYEPSDFPDIHFLWSPAQGQLTPDSLFNMVLSPVDTQLYMRVVRSGACLDTSFAKVTVIIPPPISITPSQASICRGDQVQLNATVPNGVGDLSWTPENNSLSCKNCLNPIASPLSSTVYTLSGKYFGCPTSAQSNIQVRMLPQFQFPSDLDLCGGESLQLNLVSEPGTSYTWSSSDPSFGVVYDPQPIVTPSLPQTVYTVVADNGCTNSANLTVKTTSSSLSLSEGDTICKGSTALLSASTSIPGSFNWSNGNNQPVQLVKPDVTTTYYLTYTFGDQCVLKDSVTIIVQGQNASPLFPNDQELCLGESVSLNASPVPGASYTWASNPPGYSSNDPAPLVTPDAGTTTYYATSTYGICTKTDSVKIIVYSAQLNMPPDTTICGGENLELLAQANTTGNFIWSNGSTNGELSLDSLIKSGTYAVVFNYGSPNAQCSTQDSVHVTVKSAFNLGIVADPAQDYYNLGDTLNLRAIVSPTMSLNGFQFFWKNGTDDIGGKSEEISVKINESVEDTVVLTYSVTAIGPNGCSKTARIRVYVIPPLIRVPNAFTPNGDGRNDTFKLLALSGKAQILRMTIYNRWGSKVFESTDADAEWDGKTGGQEAPTDVYIYQISWRDGSGALKKPEEGQVSLIR